MELRTLTPNRRKKKADLSALLNSDQLYGLIQGGYVARRLPSGAAKHVEAPRNSPVHKTRDKTRYLIQVARRMLTEPPPG